MMLGVVYAETFKVGVVLSLTGSLARGGNNFYEGVVTGVDLFNRESSTHKIELMVIDDESKPANSIAATEKLYGQGVVAVIGGTSSDIVIPTAAAANRMGLLYFTAGGTNSELVSLGYKTFFRLNNVKGYSKALATMITDKMPEVKKVSLVYSNRSATTEATDVVVELLENAKITVIRHSFDPNIRDFKPIINKIKVIDKPDIIAMIGYENDYVTILRAVKVLKPDVKAMVGFWYIVTVQMTKEFPDLLNNVFGTELISYPVADHGEDGLKFSTAFSETYHKEPDYLNVYGYVLAQVLSDALVRGNEEGILKEKGGLIKAMRKTDLMTLIGQVEFDEFGDTIHFVSKVAQYQDGENFLIWPDEEATGEMRYPALPW